MVSKNNKTKKSKMIEEYQKDFDRFQDDLRELANELIKRISARRLREIKKEF